MAGEAEQSLIVVQIFQIFARWTSRINVGV
jgi:hypothetical protein